MSKELEELKHRISCLESQLKVKEKMQTKSPKFVTKKPTHQKFDNFQNTLKLSILNELSNDLLCDETEDCQEIKQWLKSNDFKSSKFENKENEPFKIKKTANFTKPKPDCDLSINIKLDRINLQKEKEILELEKKSFQKQLEELKIQKQSISNQRKEFQLEKAKYEAQVLSFEREKSEFQRSKASEKFEKEKACAQNSHEIEILKQMIENLCHENNTLKAKMNYNRLQISPFPLPQKPPIISLYENPSSGRSHRRSISTFSEKGGMNKWDSKKLEDLEARLASVLNRNQH